MSVRSALQAERRLCDPALDQCLARTLNFGRCRRRAVLTGYCRFHYNQRVAPGGQVKAGAPRP